METLDRAAVVDEQFVACLKSNKFPQPHSHTNPVAAGLSEQDWLSMFHSQLVSRHLDLLARKLKETNEAYYTIGSSGHEGNAAIAFALHVEDMAFLHYRSGAFFVQRAKQAQTSYLNELILSLVASSKDPISGGRHKVFGSKQLNIPPQTSTIASHLPKAMGTAFAITKAKALKHKGHVASNSVVVCSFGDASLNHSTAQGALNTIQWIVQSRMPLPLIFVCEDNGIGISVPTPSTWVLDTIASMPYIEYLACDGRNLADVYQKTKEAQRLARQEGKAVFLHMKTVRLLGHAGSDIESQYRSTEQIQADEKDDPLLHTVYIGIQQGWLTAESALKLYEEVRATVSKEAEQALTEPKLTSADSVMASIIPPNQKRTAPKQPTDDAREAVFGKQFTDLHRPRNMCQLINIALTDLMLQYPNMMLFGEDVGLKGGVYRVTADLQKRFGLKRVFDTPLDEQTILGTALGLSHNGFIPVAEIQFLAYLHNAVDQMRGEAATLSFFSSGQYTNPMILRLPSFAYQKGFGGHFHNDNAFGFLREIPGIVIACPRDGLTAVKLFRQAMRLAYQEQRVVIMMEPIARYMTKDLHESGDSEFLSCYPKDDTIAEVDSIETIQSGEDLLIITYGNGCFLSQRATRALAQQYGVSVGIVNLQWLAPLPLQSLLQSVSGYSKVLIVDECRQTGSVSEQIVTGLVEHCTTLPKIKRVCAKDSFIPLGLAWQYIVPGEQDIITAALALLKD